MRRFLLLTSITLWILLSVPARSGELIDIEWETDHASVPPQLDADLRGLLPPLRTAIGVFPESVIVEMTLSQPQLLGLPVESARTLTPLIKKRYQQIAEDPLFGKAQSHLGYCFSESRPLEGLARVYFPDDHTAESPVILFLHGTGGSFIWYQQWLAEVFPEFVIICPAYGIQPDAIPMEYLSGCLEAASTRAGHPLRKPILMGLSAGGFAACRLIAGGNLNPFNHTVILGAYPPQDSLKPLPAKTSMSFLAGEHEFFVANGQLKRAIRLLQSKGGKATLYTIPGADHFFLLTHPEESKQALKNAVGPIQK